MMTNQSNIPLLSNSQEAIEEADPIDFKEKIANTFFSAQRIFYPMRPILTLSIGLVLMILGFLNVLPVTTAVLIGAIFVTDDLILYPMLRIFGYILNLKTGKKIFKSIAITVMTLLGYLAGGLIGYFIIINLPSIFSIIALITAASDCAISVIAGCCLLGGILARLFNFPTIVGVGIFGLAAPFLPIIIPVAIDTIVLSTLIGGFLGNYLTKQILRLAYKLLLYGHSNADGYYYAHDTEHVTELDRAQALKLHVPPETVKNTRAAIMHSIEAIKDNSHYGTKVTGTRQQMTNSYKDMLHLLMLGNSDAEFRNMRELMQEAILIAEQPLHYDVLQFSSVYNTFRCEYLDWKREESPLSQQEQDEFVHRDQLQAQINSMNGNMRNLLTRNHESRYQFRHTLFKLGVEGGIARMKKSQYENTAPYEELEQAADTLLKQTSHLNS